MQLFTLLQELNYESNGDLNIEVVDLVYDSRKVVPGCVFVCLKGATVNGHHYAMQAIKDGAIALVVQEEITGAVACTVPIITVPNTRLALAKLSAAYFGHPAKEIPVVGITGTKGKTTTAYMLCSILEAAGKKTGLIGTVGVKIGENIYETNNTTPESYELQRYLRQMITEGCTAAVVEASSIGLKDYRTAGMDFEVGIFTNFSEDHIGGNEHQSMAEYLQSKSLLFRQCKLGIINIDDPAYEDIIKEHTCMIETTGLCKEADYMGSDIKLCLTSEYLGVNFQVASTLSFRVTVAIPGTFSVYNALQAIAASVHFGVTEAQIKKGLLNVRVNGRVERIPVHGDYTLLIDYAHNAVSMQSVLTTLRAYQPKRLICLFGAGGNRAKSRRAEVGQVCGTLADLSVVTADNSRFEPVADIIEDIVKGFDKTNGQYVVIPDRKKAIEYCMQTAEPGDMVVLCGKGHETYQEVAGVRHHFDEHEIVREIDDRMTNNEDED